MKKTETLSYRKKQILDSCAHQIILPAQRRKPIGLEIMWMNSKASGCVSYIVPLSFARGIIRLTLQTSLHSFSASLIKLEFHNKAGLRIELISTTFYCWPDGVEARGRRQPTRPVKPLYL